MDKVLKSNIINIQKNEITGYAVYKSLSERSKNKHNQKILSKIADHEFKHYNILRSYTNKDVKPAFFKFFLYMLFSKIFGLTFSLKLMEKNEKESENVYSCAVNVVNEVKDILKEEEYHEHELLNLINEKKLDYIGSVVLGLNDALVELTGALAGFTFALQDSKLIALLGLITGIAASFSMAASEYLSKRHENDKNAFSSSIYTGTAYILTVVFLILPYLLLFNPFFSMGVMLFVAVMIIFFFNYYISIAKDLNFKKRFLEMAFISIGVSALSFLMGMAVKKIFNIEI